MSNSSAFDSKSSEISHQYKNVKNPKKNKFDITFQRSEIEMTNLKSSSINNSNKYLPYKKEETALISNTINDMPIEKDISLSQLDQFTYNKHLKGSLLLCCYDKNGSPLICIGPHCTHLYSFIIRYLINRAIYTMLVFICFNYMFLLFLWTLEFTKRLHKRCWSTINYCTA